MPTVNHREIALSPDEQRALICTPDEFMASNVPARRQLLLDQITEAQRGNAPFKHDQGWWAKAHVINTDSPDPAKNHCGWAFCAAGWTLLLAGEEDRFEMIPVDYDGYTVISSSEGAIRQRAQELLGLDDRAASRIFDSCTTTAEIREGLTSFDVVEFNEYGEPIR